MVYTLEGTDYISMLAQNELKLWVMDEFQYKKFCSCYGLWGMVGLWVIVQFLIGTILVPRNYYG